MRVVMDLDLFYIRNRDTMMGLMTDPGAMRLTALPHDG